MYAHSELLPHTLELLYSLNTSYLTVAQENLQRIIMIASDPDPVVAVTIYCRIIKRWLLEQPSKVQIDQTVIWLFDWLNKVYSFLKENTYWKPFGLQNG